MSDFGDFIGFNSPSGSATQPFRYNNEDMLPFNMRKGRGNNRRNFKGRGRGGGFRGERGGEIHRGGMHGGGMYLPQNFNNQFQNFQQQGPPRFFMDSQGDRQQFNSGNRDDFQPQNQGANIEQYYSPRMLEDPWYHLKQRRNQVKVADATTNQSQINTGVASQSSLSKTEANQSPQPTDDAVIESDDNIEDNDDR